MFRKSAKSKPADPDHGSQCETAIAFPHEIDATRNYPLFNFFPIKNALSPFDGLLIHASFLLKADRDELAEADAEFHKSLTGELANLLKSEAIPAMVNQHGPECLNLLGQAGEQANEQIQTIHTVMHDAVSNSIYS